MKSMEIAYQRTFWKMFLPPAAWALSAISSSLEHLSLPSGENFNRCHVHSPFPTPSSLFTSHLNLNETSTNSTVPWGLWALPTTLDDLSLPTLPNVQDVPGLGRRRRETPQEATVAEDFSGKHFEVGALVDQNYGRKDVSKSGTKLNQDKHLERLIQP